MGTEDSQIHALALGLTPPHALSALLSPVPSPFPQLFPISVAVSCAPQLLTVRTGLLQCEGAAARQVWWLAGQVCCCVVAEPAGVPIGASSQGKVCAELVLAAL
jgi:hypothetical protein